MIKTLGKSASLIALTALMLFAAGYRAEAISLQDIASKDDKKSDRAGKPTTIVSDSMDIDFQKNIAVFTGNVFVDDPQMTIKCHKMTIYLREKEKTEDKGKPVKTEKSAGDSLAGLAPGGSGKDLDKIVCIGNVIIIRKVVDTTEQQRGEQRAEAGQAVYDVTAGTIVLTEDSPKISRGKDDLSGSKITMWLESERMKVESNDRDQPAKINFQNTSDKAKEEKPAEKENP